MTQSFIVPGPLPGMNEIIAAAKSGRGRANGYGRLKAAWTATVAAHARGLAPVGACDLYLLWTEKHRRRDPDNFTAAIKFLCDGLIKAGVLENDGWGQIRSFTHYWEVGPRPRVLVQITEAT